MPRFERHVFICTNVRSPENPKGCCAAKGSAEVAARFKEEMHKRGLRGRMRSNTSGCLDACEFGITVAVYPEGTYYGHVSVDDVVEIVESHLIGGKPVERLMIRTPMHNPELFEPIR
jgi:(2Fe-2S) ferredoxin